MDKNFSDEKTCINLASPIVEDISPYDTDYPFVLITNSLKKRIAGAQATAEAIYRVVEKQAPLAAQVKQSFKKGCRYVVDVSEKTLDDIEHGKIKLTDEHGMLYAQIRNKTGYGKKLPIKRDEFCHGIDLVQFANALQMQALQTQLHVITEQINLISYNLKDILQGQHNDRIGLYYSGMSLLIEARNITNAELKQALIVQSLKTLSEATFQLILTMQSDIHYLENKEYQSAKGKSAALIDERMQKINQSFAIIHKAILLRAGIYCDQGELAAMFAVLDEYSRFIENIVVKNVILLSSYDKADDGTDRGLWSSRTSLKLDVAGITEKLNMTNKSIYLGIYEEIEE